jgi:hypothetical protein
VAPVAADTRVEPEADVPDPVVATVPDRSDWAVPGEEAAASGSDPVATVETRRWLLDPPGSRTFVPSRREATAVDTYCAELCPPAAAAAAAGEILETFTGSGAADLLSHTRVVAAQHTAARRDQPRLRRRRERACDSTPALLAARANNTLGDAEAAELDAHLSSCLPCQALELRSQRAERAFAGILAAGVAAGIDQDATATMHEAVADDPPAGATSGNPARWIPDLALAAATTAEDGTGHLQTPADPPTRRRRIVGAGLASAVVIAATIAAIVLITGSNNSHHVVSSRLAAVHSPPKSHNAARHSAAKAHSRAHKRAAVVQRAHHTKAHRTVTTAPATPASTSSPPALTTTPVVSQQPSTPASTPAPTPSTPASSQRIVSVQQPSLGAVSAPTQRIGSK